MGPGDSPGRLGHRGALFGKRSRATVGGRIKEPVLSTPSPCFLTIYSSSSMALAKPTGPSTQMVAGPVLSAT